MIARHTVDRSLGGGGGEADVERWLDTDPADEGCAIGTEILERYVELELAGAPVAAAFPATHAHLRLCPECARDHDGLLAAAAQLAPI